MRRYLICISLGLLVSLNINSSEPYYWAERDERCGKRKNIGKFPYCQKIRFTKQKVQDYCNRNVYFHWFIYAPVYAWGISN